MIEPIPGEHRPVALWIAVAAVGTAAVMAWAGREFYVRAWKNLRHGTSDMNSLVALGTGAAFLYSLVATVAPGLFTSAGVSPDVYYEAVLWIVGFVLLFAFGLGLLVWFVAGIWALYRVIKGFIKLNDNQPVVAA